MTTLHQVKITSDLHTTCSSTVIFWCQESHPLTQAVCGLIKQFHSPFTSVMYQVNSIILFTMICFLLFIFTAINDLKKRLILHAIHQWSRETCIRFQRKPQEHQLQSHGRRRGRNMNHRISHWVNFRADSTGCYSFVGRDETCIHQGQPLSISRGCDSVGYRCYFSRNLL